MAAVGSAPASGAALKPLFAPYCPAEGQAFDAALQLLLTGEFKGFRPLQGGAGHAYMLRWSGALAPLDAVNCNLSFPERQAVHYTFAVPAHHLLGWLARLQSAGQAQDLPVDFWHWLILGAGTGA